MYPDLFDKGPEVVQNTFISADGQKNIQTGVLSYIQTNEHAGRQTGRLTNDRWTLLQKQRQTN